MDRYAVGTNNRYALFLGEEDTADPQDIRKLVEIEKSKKTLKAAGAAAKENKVTNKDVQGVNNKTPKAVPAVMPTVPEEEMEKVKNRRNRDDRPVLDPKPRVKEQAEGPKREDAPRRPRDIDVGRREVDRYRPRRERPDWNDGEIEGRPDYRSGGANRPRPRQTTPNSRRKRDFDRKSGSDKTGVKHVHKREGGGAHNWGTIKDDLASSDLFSSDEVESPEKTEAEAEAAEPEEAEEVVEAVKELTLDEYRALRGTRQQPQFNLRQAGEGEDLTRWNNLIEIKKKSDEESDDEELENIEFPQRVNRQRQVLDIDITFKDTRRGGRPGRGGPRTRPNSRIEFRPDSRMEYRPNPRVEFRPNPRMEFRPNPRMDVRSNPRMDFRSNPRSNPRMEFRPNTRMEFRSNTRVDSRNNPREFRPDAKYFGGRRQHRGRRGRHDVGPSSQYDESTPRVNDEKDFPSLG